MGEQCSQHRTCVLCTEMRELRNGGQKVKQNIKEHKALCKERGDLGTDKDETHVSTNGPPLRSLHL